MPSFRGLRCGSRLRGGRCGVSLLWCGLDHRQNLVLREFGELVPNRATSGRVQQAHHERAFLLEQEDVAGALTVDVTADDPHRLLVVVRERGMWLGRGG